MKVVESEFGTIDGKVVTEYLLRNYNGMEVRLLNYGAIIHDIKVPDKNGVPHGCVQSLNSLHDYISDEGYRGAIVGRYANRIGHGTFNLNGVAYQLEKNGGEHNLHGGLSGFHKKLWRAETRASANTASVHFFLVSLDGESGFPGNVQVEAVYSLSQDNELSLRLNAHTDKDTPLSLTQHAYFTLSREVSVANTQVKINATKITDADATLLPTGKFVDVAATPFDFTALTPIARQIDKTHPLFDMVGGYDHNYVLSDSLDSTEQAQVYAEDTGISMKVFTNLPGIQFYTGNLRSSQQLGALCLEPQYFPDSPNQPHFPCCIITPKKPFSAYIKYQFTAA
jgi:aldose 1-epimerase